MIPSSPSRSNSAATKHHPWLALFFAFGTSMCALTIALLVFPGTVLDVVWRLNPDARVGFQGIGSWSIVIMLVVGTACIFAAIGLWRGTNWGTRLAAIILGVNMTGDLISAVQRHDYRMLIGLPIAAGIIVYLLRSEKRCAAREGG